MARQTCHGRNQRFLFGVQLSPCLRILPPRPQNSLRTAHRPRHRESRRRLRRISIVGPSRIFTSVSDSITDKQAVFVEPLAAACEILDQLNMKQFREAAVLGDGKLAQLIARVLRTALPRVVMYGKHKDKLQQAAATGIETQIVLRRRFRFKTRQRYLAS